MTIHFEALRVSFLHLLSIMPSGHFRFQNILFVVQYKFPSFFPRRGPAKGPFSKYLQIQFLRGASHKEGARISQYETQIPRNVLSRSQMVHPLVTQSPTLSWQFLSPVVLQFSSNLQSPSLSTFYGLYSNISPCFVTTETKSRCVKIPRSGISEAIGRSSDKQWT